MQPKILIASGGTGGHIFPAVALAEEMTSKWGCKVLFAGGNLSQNPFLESTFPFEEVACTPWNRSLKHCYKGPVSFLKGFFQSLKIVQKFKPDAVVGFGSFYTLPIMAASLWEKVPFFLHEQNSIPGKVNRLLAPFAELTFTHFPCTSNLLKGKSLRKAFPLRANFKKDFISKKEARAYFQLHPDVKTLLIFGGSQGAQKINHLFSECAINHLKERFHDFQIIHFTGDLKSTDDLKRKYDQKGILAYVKPFEKKINIAWAAADFSITRAGACSIAEQMEFEVPGILIPYPFATDQHQDKNADWLVDSHLAIKAKEEELTSKNLAIKLQELYLKTNSQDTFKKLKETYFDIPISQEIIQWITKK